MTDLNLKYINIKCLNGLYAIPLPLALISGTLVKFISDKKKKMSLKLRFRSP